MRWQGGQNKTHEQLERYYRMDSYAIDGAYGDICVGKYVFDYACDEVTEKGYIERFECGKFCQNVEIVQHKCACLQWFFLCPKCGSRRRYLYLTRTGFLCRKCAGLNYKRQQATRDCFFWAEMAYSYAERELQFDRKGYVPADLEGLIIRKPKWMRWTTYRKKIARFEKYRNLYLQKSLEEVQAILSKGNKRRT